VALAAVAADQLTKAIVTSRLGIGDEVHVAGPFSIHHVENSGIAFGFFASATSLVILLTAVAVIWMVYFFARSGARHTVLPVALGLVIGGILLLALVAADRNTARPRRVGEATRP
jgi:signal peptidase II